MRFGREWHTMIMKLMTPSNAAMVEQKQLAQIDGWLAAGEAKRAELHIARLLRTEHPPLDRANLLFRRARARLLLERPDEALEDLQTLHALQPDLWLHSEI